MNSPGSHIPGIETLVRKALRLKQQIDRTLSTLQEEAEGIRVYYEPRAEFDRWKQTKEGEEWKRGKWQRQKQCCAACNCKIPLKGSHIDHVKPLSKYPELSLTLSNLRITCPECNLGKSDR
ncbi:MAG: HNH endonuclease signature motif containing protein [Cyanobacteria bacterium P01_E01_bin.34]